MSASEQSSPPPPPPANIPVDPLDRLRQLRMRPDRARGLGEVLAQQMKSIKKISKTESAAIEAWETAVPDRIGDCCRFGGLRGGKLVVHVENASERYLVDRWLASGGLGTLRALARVPIGSVELIIIPKVLNEHNIHDKTL